MNERGRRYSALAATQITNSNVAKQAARFPRCRPCGAYLSRYCPTCRGVPDSGVSVERLARGVAAVDRAVDAFRGRCDA